jgi:hypothetical protein
MGYPGSRPLAVVTGRPASLFDRLTTLDRKAARRLNQARRPIQRPTGSLGP